MNAVKFFSDRDVRNWYGGRDYFVFGTASYHLPSSLQEFLDGTTLECANVHHLGATSPFPYRWKNFASEYEVQVPYSVEEVQQYLYRFNTATSIMVAVPSTRYFSGSFTKKKIDMIKEKVFVEVGNLSRGEVPTVSSFRVRLGHEVGIRYFLQGLFYNISFSRILHYPVTKVGLVYPHPNGIAGYKVFYV